MSTHPLERTIRQSVLDRLIDDGTRSEARTWEESAVAFKRSVMRDLQWLLNTRRVFPSPPRELDLVLASVYNFGIRDLSSRSADSQDVRAEIQREVQDAITTFEPRLSKVRVTPAPVERGSGQIRFKIEAELRTDPNPEAVVFETTLDTASKAIVVRESIDA